MPLPVPRLDDRTFAELVREGESLIPRYGGEWTDRNASDPGVTLVELFAWLTETAIYQLDRIPPASVEAFVRLLGESRAVYPDGTREGVDAALSRAVKGVGERRRAVTAAEFEALALETDPGAGPGVARARFLRLTAGTCLTPGELRQKLGSMAPTGTTGGQGEAAAVVIVPADRVSPRPTPSIDLIERVFRRLNERRVLGTRMRVFGPDYVPVAVSATVARRRGSGLTRERVQAEVARFLSALEGGEDGRGWTFGRPVYKSELYQLLEGMAAVDHVADLRLFPVQGGVASGGDGVSEVLLPEYGLVDAARERIAVTVVEGA
jgi:hypothetical protein